MNHETNTLTKFAAVIKQADAIQVDGGPLVTSWQFNPPSDDPDNEVLKIEWDTKHHAFEVILTEECIEAGAFDGDLSFKCCDSDGAEVRLRMYKLTPIS